MRLRLAIISVVKRTPTASQPVPRNIAYTFPTIDALTGFLLSRALPGNSKPSEATHKRIIRSIAKFSSDFLVHKPGKETVQGKVVALSGSTGSLGSSLLALLLGRPDVSKVYLLNRKGRGTQKERQAKGFLERGLDPKVLDEKTSIIAYLDIDLSKRGLGLPSKDYEEVSSPFNSCLFFRSHSKHFSSAEMSRILSTQRGT
jgi:hypothetical protein